MFRTCRALAPEDILQTESDTCAIKAQQILLEQHGISLSEHELMREAEINGWYTPGDGTRVEDVGKLLELHGIEVERNFNATLDDLTESLAHGNSVIVGVDSGELWHPGIIEKIEDRFCGPCADHALIASGICVDPLSGEHEVMLTDPGTGDVLHSYEMDTFLDAWADSGNFMLSII